MVFVDFVRDTQRSFTSIQPVEALILDDCEDIGREIGAFSDFPIAGSFQVDTETLHDQIFSHTGVADIASSHGFEPRFVAFKKVRNFLRFCHPPKRE